jgi:hypothetical protein
MTAGMEENYFVIVHFTTVLIISIHMITTQSVYYDGIIIALCLHTNLFNITKNKVY